MMKLKRILWLPLVLLCTIHADEPNRPHQKKSHRKPMDIKTLPSGLKYAITEPTKNEHAQEAKLGQQATVHYTGWLETKSKDKPFDSSITRGKPFTFTVGVGQVIRGWDEGVKGM